MKPKDMLLERWRAILAQKPSAPAIFDTRGRVARTFQQIEERARAFESEMQNLPAGHILAVQIGNHDDWPAIFLGCLRRGVIVLPLEQSISERQRDAALKICRASSLVAADSSGSIQILTLKPEVLTTEWGNKIPVLLKLTSGTTATPRAIRFRSHQLVADCDQICETKGISDADLNFAVIPVSHSYGFSNLLTPLIARGVAMVLSRDRTPRAVLEDLRRTKATVFPAMPVFYQAFCELENAPTLPELRLCISAGAPLSLNLARKFREKFGLLIHSFYGASECGGICYDHEAKHETEGYVGAPMQGVEVELIDPVAEPSQVRVRSAAVGDGYFPENDKEKLGKGIFVPDDLLVAENAGLRIAGRISDLINVAGKKVSPAEIEETLLHFPGVRQAVAFGRESPLRNEEVVACIVGDRDLREKDLLEFCAKQLSAWQVPKRFFMVDSIPINERGKISRRDLAKRFRL